MPKTLVKDFRKQVKMMIAQQKMPKVPMNPVDQMIDMAKKQQGMM